MAVADRKRDRPERVIRPEGEEEQASAVKTSETPKLRPIRRLRELWRYREILGNLTRKEVKVKYTSSVLGAAWSMLNPILYLAVFSLVFGVVLTTGIDDFPIYLLSGLLAWNLFAGALSMAARSVVENANLVKKVYFPLEILPLASIGASLVDFALQSVVLAVVLAIGTYPLFGLNLVLLPLAIAALLMFTAATSMWVGALNVRYRDTQHLLNLTLLMGFWLTPVVYPFGFMQHQLVDLIGPGGFYAYMVINPMAPIVAGFQRSIYRFVDTDPDPVRTTLLNTSIGNLAIMLGLVILGSAILLLLAWRHYFRQAGDFAEDL